MTDRASIPSQSPQVKDNRGVGEDYLEALLHLTVLMKRNSAIILHTYGFPTQSEMSYCQASTVTFNSPARTPYHLIPPIIFPIVFPGSAFLPLPHVLCASHCICLDL